jgi:signal transduction histidine kinase
VGWGGNPTKAAEPADLSGGLALHPRRSFELWKQEVRHCSVSWDPADIAAAVDLRRSAIEIDLYRQVKREQEAVKARDDLVAVVAHDLRNPMSVVVMQSTLIQRLLAQDASERGQRLRASAQIVGRAGERMSSLLNELLDLAKIEAGRFEIVPSRQSVSHIIQDAYELLQPLCEAKRVTLVSHPAPELQIQADPERVFQVLSNLIGNAIKFSPHGEEIHLSAAPAAGNLCEFAVRDRGPGIAPDQLARIFDRYWQARPAEAGGAGLGLYISRGIVEAHGGTIRAESREGHGTTMFFTVPLASDWRGLPPVPA